MVTADAGDMGDPGDTARRGAGSSAERTHVAPADPPAPTDAEVADALWARMARPFVLAEVVDAFLGLPMELVEHLAAVKLASGDEAGDLLAAMPTLLRSLTTSVASVSVRSRGEIRGPVLWSETFSARAASGGQTDLFVCTSPQRDYETAENRVLVAALAAIADASKALEGRPGAEYEDWALRVARERVRTAGQYLAHPALVRVTRAHPAPRTVKRARGGKKGDRYGPAFAMLERADEALGPDDLAPFTDRRTRLQHRVLLAVLDELDRRGLHLPALRVEQGRLLAGPVSYVHPRTLGHRDRLHGIVVGEVLLDVPDRRELSRAQASDLLAARSEGRPTVLVTGVADVALAVDVAVQWARRRTAVAQPIEG